MSKTTDQMMADFLARGGQIQRVPAVDQSRPVTVVPSASAKTGPQLMDLEEAELFFGENRSRNKTDTDEEVRDLLVKVVERNPSFLEKHKIPDKYVQLLPEELRSAARIKTKKVRQKIDTSFIDPELAAILAKENPQVLKDLGIEQQQSNLQESGAASLHTVDC